MLLILLEQLSLRPTDTSQSLYWNISDTKFCSTLLLADLLLIWETRIY